MASAVYMLGVPSATNGTLEAFKEQLGKCRELTWNQDNLVWELKKKKMESESLKMENQS